MKLIKIPEEEYYRKQGRFGTVIYTNFWIWMLSGYFCFIKKHAILLYHNISIGKSVYNMWAVREDLVVVKNN